MSLENIFYVSQSIAAVAVVASILYLAQQVRQADRVQRATMQQGRADRAALTAMALASPELARVFLKGVAGDPNLTPEEFTQWMQICRSAFLSGEDSFLQHEAGMISDAAFNSYVEGVKFYFAMPGMRAAWTVSQAQFGAGFRAFGNDMLAKTATAERPDTYSRWKKLIASQNNDATAPP